MLVFEKRNYCCTATISAKISTYIERNVVMDVV